MLAGALVKQAERSGRRSELHGPGRAARQYSVGKLRSRERKVTQQGGGTRVSADPQFSPCLPLVGVRDEGTGCIEVARSRGVGGCLTPAHEKRMVLGHILVLPLTMCP